MKTTSRFMIYDLRRRGVSVERRKSKGIREGGFLPKAATPAVSRPPSAMAFTLVELLVVIAIIAILAAMLLPVLNIAMTHARKTQAKLEVNQIATAITQYESQYSRMPVSMAVQQSGMTNVTYGGIYYNDASPSVQWPLTTWTPWTFGASPSSEGYYTPDRGIYITNNSEVISILMDYTNFPNTTIQTVNTNFQKNPMQTIFLSGKTVGDTSSPGIGTDLNYRDPWGNPYLITLNLNEDNATEDPFYAPPAVSSATALAGGAGINGLNLQTDGNYAYHGNVMVWSMGPYGPFNHSPSSFDYPPTAPPVGGPGLALDSNNKNHVLSWAQ